MQAEYLPFRQSPIRMYFSINSSNPKANGGTSYMIYFSDTDGSVREYLFADEITSDPRQIGSFLDAYKAIKSIQLKNLTTSSTCIVIIADHKDFRHDSFHQIDLNDDDSWMKLILTYS